MLERYERPIRIVCYGLAALLVCELAFALFGGDPLKHLKIPALPTLAETTNQPAKAVVAAKIGTNTTNKTNSTNTTNAVVAGTNAIGKTNVAASTNAAGDTNILAKSTNAPKAGDARKGNAPNATPGLPPGMTPDMLASLPPEVVAQIMGGGMPGGRPGGAKKVELPPEVQSRVDRIIDSEVFGAVPRPMPMALIGLTDQEAFIRATNGQTGPLKVGGEMAGIKLLRIGVNRALVEQDGEKKELTLFDGIGSESLMPKTANEPSTNGPSTNSISTNAAPTNAPPKRARRKPADGNVSTNQTLSSNQKEIP